MQKASKSNQTYRSFVSSCHKSATLVVPVHLAYPRVEEAQSQLSARRRKSDTYMHVYAKALATSASTISVACIVCACVWKLEVTCRLARTFNVLSCMLIMRLDFVRFSLTAP